MAQRVLIGVDGSAASAAALSWGLDYAKHHKADVTLLQVADDSFLSDRSAFASESQAVSDRILKWGIDLARTSGFDGNIEGLAIVGHPVAEFEKLAKDADLVVLGDHTGSKVGGAFFGSRSVKIAAVSAAPVIVVPEHIISHPRYVLVGIDGSRGSENALHFAAEEASRRALPLRTVYAWMPPITPGLEQLWSEELLSAQHDAAEEALAIATAGLAERYPDVKIEREVVQAPPIGALLAAGKDAALMVVGSRGRGGLTRFLLGSVSQGVLSEPPCAVAVTRG